MQVDIGDYFIIGVDKCNIPLWDCNRGSGYAFHCYKIAKVIHKGDEQSPYPNMNAVIQYSTNDPDDKVNWTIPLYICKDRAYWPLHIGKEFKQITSLEDGPLWFTLELEGHYTMGHTLFLSDSVYAEVQTEFSSKEYLGFDITKPIAEASFTSYFNELIPDRKIAELNEAQESKIRRTMREWPYGFSLINLLFREDADDKLSATYTYKWYWKKDSSK